MKNFPIKALIISLVIVVTLAAVVSAQKSTASIKWERYSVIAKDVSVSFPKLPTRVSEWDACSKVDIEIYYAYASDTVYSLRLNKESSKEVIGCLSLASFNKKTLDRRISSLEKSYESKGENKPFGSLPGVSFSKESDITWLIDDVKNKRWFELRVVSRFPVGNLSSMFLDSFGLNQPGNSTPVGEGSPAVIGDAVTAETANPTITDSLPTTPGKDGELVILSKPRPGYTDKAREKNVQGTVLLKVVFLANGSVDEIEVIKGLEQGLSERAVAAARKIAFLPMKMKQQNVSVVKKIEYSFQIY